MNSALCGRPKDVPTRKAGAKLLHFPDIRKKKHNYFQTVSTLSGILGRASTITIEPAQKAGSSSKGLLRLLFCGLLLALQCEEPDEVACNDAEGCCC